jgi:acyl-CoA reductase-like NAD-dependent aldehyde dehydrogenase
VRGSTQIGDLRAGRQVGRDRRARGDLLRDALIVAVSAMPIGDPHDPATALGPLISELQGDRVEGYVASARANSSEGYPTLMLTSS